MARPNESSPEQIAEQRDRVLAEIRQRQEKHKAEKEHEFRLRKLQISNSILADDIEYKTKIKDDTRVLRDGRNGEDITPRAEKPPVILETEYAPNKDYSERRREVERVIFERQGGVLKSYRENRGNIEWTQIQAELEKIRQEEIKKARKIQKRETDLKVRPLRDKLLKETRGEDGKRTIGEEIKSIIDAENSKFNEEFGVEQETTPPTDEERIQELRTQLQESKTDTKEEGEPVAKKENKIVTIELKETGKGDVVFDYEKHIEEEKLKLEEKREEYIKAESEYERYLKERYSNNEKGVKKVGQWFRKGGEVLGLVTKKADEEYDMPDYLKTLKKEYEHAKKSYGNAMALSGFKELVDKGIVGGKPEDQKKQNERFDAEYRRRIIEETVFKEREIKDGRKIEALPPSERGMFGRMMDKYRSVPSAWRRVLTIGTLTGFSIIGGAGVGTAAAFGALRLVKSYANAEISKFLGERADRHILTKISDWKKEKSRGKLEKDFSLFSLQDVEKEYERMFQNEEGE